MKEFHIPLWIVLSAHSAIALGTMTGGWRIVKTMGQKIVKLRPIDGFCAETASAISIFLATHAGIPVSTTHVITGAVTGVGAVKNAHAVKWQVTLKIVWAWIFTIPAAAALRRPRLPGLQALPLSLSSKDGEIRPRGFQEPDEIPREPGRLRAVDDPVVEGQAERQDRS